MFFRPMKDTAILLKPGNYRNYKPKSDYQKNGNWQNLTMQAEVLLHSWLLVKQSLGK